MTMTSGAYEFVVVLVDDVIPVDGVKTVRDEIGRDPLLTISTTLGHQTSHLQRQTTAIVIIYIHNSRRKSFEAAILK